MGERIGLFGNGGSEFRDLFGKRFGRRRRYRASAAQAAIVNDVHHDYSVDAVRASGGAWLVHGA
jgi:hypothetical protein